VLCTPASLPGSSAQTGALGHLDVRHVPSRHERRQQVGVDERVPNPFETYEPGSFQCHGC
jgi:hypothetical protein